MSDLSTSLLRRGTPAPRAPLKPSLKITATFALYDDDKLIDPLRRCGPAWPGAAGSKR